MAKIPFDINKRPEIEAGKYEVVTRLDTPVKILCYDARGKYPIAGLVRGEESDSAQTWRIDGTFVGRNESSYDLFLVSDEPELTELEKVLLEIVHIKPEEATEIELRGMRIYRDQALAIARKELQPEIDAEVEKAYKNSDRMQYEKGREDALKDLPRWKKCAPCDEDKATIPAWIVRFDAELAGESAVVHNGHYILFGELEKLPKEG